MLIDENLLSLGITPGVELAVIRVAPLGCPIQIEVRGTSLTLRKEEACQLEMGAFMTHILTRWQS